MTPLHVPQIREDADPISGAIAWANAGWYIGPLDPAGKHAGSVLSTGWPDKTSRDPMVIADWFMGSDRQPFVHCGRSGAIAFDLDDPTLVPEILRAAIIAEKPPLQTSRRIDDDATEADVIAAFERFELRGHVFFAQPPGRTIGNSNGSLGRAWGEVRGKNGVVVVDPARHSKAAQGGHYRVRRAGPLPVLPAYVANLLPDAGDTGGRATDAEVNLALVEWVREDAGRRLDVVVREWDKLVRQEGASRHATLVHCLPWAARDARAGLYRLADAVDALRERWDADTSTALGSGRVLRPQEARSEFDDALAWAVNAAQLEPAQKVAERAQRATRPRQPPLLAPTLSGPFGDAQEGAQTAEPDAVPVAARAGQNLPEDFWRSRPTLAHIRTAADARMASPDAVLGAVLARLSSFIPPKVRIETGIGPASLNTFVAVVGSSSAGKSRAHSTARHLLPVPVDIRDYRDALPLGSGEGLAEAYYGVVTDEEPTGETYQGGPRKGEPKMRAVSRREKVRDHASFYLDEGEALSKMLERAGATIGQTIRTAWVGETLGAANASADRLRIVEGGTYALGLVIGYQRGTVAPLLADQGGTPQRFLFLSAHRTDPPDAPVAWPGELANVAHAIPCSDLTLPPDAQAEIWHARRAAMLPNAPNEGLNGHRPLHMAKLSALFAVLDMRDIVTEEDWQLAGILWDTSRAVRDGLVHELEAQAAARRASEDDRAVTVRARAALAGHRAVAAEVDADLDRRARWVGLQVHDKGKRTIRGKDGLRIAADSNARPHLDGALAEAETRGWVVVDGDSVEPGPSRPT